MAIVINGSGEISGISVGGLPDGIVDAGTLATNSVDSAELIDGAVDDSHMASIKGRRNMVINGDMRVAQRGTSFSVTTTSTQLVDRFKTKQGSAFNLETTITQSTDVPSGEGFSHSLQIDSDAVETLSGSENGGISYDIEGIDTQQLGYGNSNAKDLTLSFWVKSNKTGTYSLQVQSLPSTGDGKYTLYAYTVTSSWTKITISIPKNTVQATANDTNARVRLFWWLVTGPSDTSSATTTWTANPSPTYKGVTGQVNFMDSTSNTFNITGVQLELGSIATDFEHRHYGEELALCQRYYNCIADGSSGILGLGVIRNTTQSTVLKYHPVEMRTNPTLVEHDTSNIYRQNGVTNTNSDGTAPSLDQGNEQCTSFNCNGFSGLTNGQVTTTKITSGGKLGLDAEL